MPVRLWLVVGQIVPNGSVALRAMDSNVTARNAMNPTNPNSVMKLV